MKKLMFVVCLGLFGMALARAELTEWRSANGHSFMGEFMGMERGSVQLKGEDGEIISVPMRALDAASQALATEAAARAAQHAPVISHSTPTYAYEFGASDDNDLMRLTFFEGGNVLPHFGEIGLRMRHSEYKVRDEKDDRMRFIEIPLKEIIKEKASGGDATLLLVYENGVEVELEIDALTDGVEYDYTVRTRPDGIEKMIFRISCSFPALLEYDSSSKLYRGELSEAGVPFNELDEFLSEFGISVTDRQDETSDYKFYESPKKMKGYKMELHTPARGDIVFEVEGSALFGVGLYGGKKIVEGFFLEHSVFQDPEEHPVFSVRLK